MYREESPRRKEQPLTNQLSLAAGLCLALVLSAPSATAQAGHSDAPTVTIFSNLGPSSTDLYFTGTSITAFNGDCIIGASKPQEHFCGRHTGETWLAMPFTPQKNSHATTLQAAVGVFDGTNQFELALFNDDHGTPGTALATVTVTDAPPAPAKGGTCCDLATAVLGSPGIALTANTQYWVVAKTDDVNAPDFEGIWAFTNFAFVGAHDLQPDGQVAWFTFQNAGSLAFAVKRTVP